MGSWGNPGEDQPLMRSGNTSSPNDDPRRTLRGIVVLVLCTVLGVFLLVAVLQCAFVVQPGTIGIVVTLGHVAAVDSGMHFRIPFMSTLEHLSAKTQLLDQANVIPTKEGLAVKLETAV